MEERLIPAAVDTLKSAREFGGLRALLILVERFRIDHRFAFISFHFGLANLHQGSIAQVLHLLLGLSAGIVAFDLLLNALILTCGTRLAVLVRVIGSSVALRRGP